jgi:predicted transposase YbfD/YdcC
MTIAAPAPCTEQAKKEGELTAARRLYPQTELHHALVTADALHCEPATMRLIVEQGGDYLLQLKANQPTAFAKAQAVAATAAPLLPVRV